MKAAEDLVLHMARFGGALRARGIAVGVGDEVDGAAALMRVDLMDRADVYQALRAALKIRRRDWQTFDEVFAEVWSAAPREAAQAREAAPAPANAGRRRPLHPSGFPLVDQVPETRRAASDGETPGYSPEIVLRRKPLDECSPAELAAMERLLARLMPRLATRKSRRLAPARARGVADLRRSFRRASGTGGELLWLARRARRVERPQLVVICDTSGSMQPHTRFLLAFAIALRRVARRTEVFAFNTSLTRVTPWLVHGRITETLDRLAAGVPDWSGGTRIGESLVTFVTRYADRLITSKTVVIIVSDGLDRGDAALVARAMRVVHAKARRVIWLNPLAGDSRYEPTARAMQAALPFVDRLAPAHTLESLERAFADLAA